MMKGYVDKNYTKGSPIAQDELRRLENEYKKLTEIQIGVDINGRRVGIRPSDYDVSDRDGTFLMVPTNKQAYNLGELPFSRKQMHDMGVNISASEFNKLVKIINTINYLRRFPDNLIQLGKLMNDLERYLSDSSSLESLYGKWENTISHSYRIELPELGEKVRVNLTDFKVVGKLSESWDYSWGGLFWKADRTSHIKLVPVEGRKIKSGSGIDGFKGSEIKIIKDKRCFRENITQAKIVEHEVKDKELSVLFKRKFLLSDDIFVPNMEPLLSERMPLCEKLSFSSYLKPEPEITKVYYAPIKDNNSEEKSRENAYHEGWGDGVITGGIIGGITFGLLGWVLGKIS